MNVKDIVSQIMMLKEDDVDSWIEDRLAFLEDNAIEDRKELSIFTVNAIRLKAEKANTEICGYIPSKTRIKKMMFDISAFKLDDKSIYKSLIDWFKKADEKYITNNSYIMDIIQCVIINYFGYHGYDKNRNALYDSKDSVDSDELSISDFKRNETAMCLERSAVGQNLLSFLGYDPMLIYGYLPSDKGKNSECHAYNCIILKEKAVLVDFTNPIYKDGAFYHTALYKVDGKQLSDFMKGKAQIEVKHKDYYTKNGELVEDITRLVYASNEIESDYFDKSKDNIEP